MSVQNRDELPFAEGRIVNNQNLLEVGILDKQNGHSNYFNYNNIAEYDFNNSRNILATYIDVSYYIKSNFSLKFGTRFENTIRNFKANSSEISSNKIVTSCGSSVSAASLALAYSLINDDYIPKIYIGSWTEFGKK